MERNKTKPIALIDCDEVLVEAAIDWLAHLNKLAKTSYTVEELGNDYHLGNFFKENHNIENPMDFWYCSNLYNDREPKRGALGGIKRLYDAGYEIFVVTYCTGNHYKSKEDFVKRWFGSYVTGMIATNHKYMVHGDLIIDDRDDHLIQFPEFVFKVRMNTPYLQKINFTPNMIINGWDDISEVIEKFEEHRARLYIP